MQYNNISKGLNKALEIMKVNPALDELEGLSFTAKVSKRLESELARQMLDLVTASNIERAFQMTRKADNNQLIIDYLSGEIEQMSPAMQEDVEQLLVLSANAGGQAAIDRINPDAGKSFNLKNKTLVKQRVAELRGLLTDTSLKFLSRKIEEAKSGMLMVDETILFLKDEIIVNVKHRALLTVTNEIATMTGRVEYEVFRRAGTEQLRWVTVLDERVCSVCAPLDGKIVSTGSTFMSPNAGELAIHPPIHGRCRCFLEPIMLQGVSLDRLWDGS